MTLQNSQSPNHKFSFISDLAKVGNFIAKPIQYIINSPTESIKVIKNNFENLNLLNPTLKEISEYLNDYTPNNMNKLRLTTFIFNT